MDKLIAKVKELFAAGDIELFIGYGKGTRIPCPLFAHSDAEAEKLVYNDDCTGNLAVYLTRKDIAGGKKVGIAASYYALRSICRLYDENQIKEGMLVILGINGDEVKELKGREEVVQFLATLPVPPKPASDEELIGMLDAMSLGERWEFWSNELSKCFKCYACRAACPMCYCTKCIVEENRPQWIDPWAATLSNMEWQVNRVMHMAGRCSDCGACGSACPLGLPVHLLSHKMVELVRENFGEPGKDGNILSTFKPDDNESFIL